TLAQQEQVEAVLIARVILNQKVKRLEAIFKAAGIESINLNSGNAKRAISAYRPGDEWALEDLLAQLGLIETHTDQEVPASQILLPDTHSIQETPIQAAQEESRDDRMIRVQDELIAAQDPLVIKALQAELVALYSQA
ncbi:hypothetical protein OAN21_02555, partial [Alphaproteobacteria bacterium]|nr:hypothetical protein [Alphaproteobacteria bacterium]